MIMTRRLAHAHASVRACGRAARRPGITLTEILIAIMILGIGLVSLATLFPIGLLRLRDAARASRSTYLAESALADLSARGLMNKNSFFVADLLNVPYGFNRWYFTAISGQYDPFVQDTPNYGGDWGPVGNHTGAFRSLGPGLPVAIDPLWRQQAGTRQVGPNTVQGTYLFDPNTNFASGVSPEARFASGIGYVRFDPDGALPSAFGLQRLTNFNRPEIQSAAAQVPSTFVSPEDMVWQDSADGNSYALAWNQTDYLTTTAGPIPSPSPLVPDLSISRDAAGLPNYNVTVDFRYSWLFTGRQTDTSSGLVFDGNIVVMENRPFGIAEDPFAQFVGPAQPTAYNVDGERVVEAVFGYSRNVAASPLNGAVGYGTAADRTVLLRWPASQPDPEVKLGSWIADVTYERRQAFANSRFSQVLSAFGTVDNQPPQRCFWYQITKTTPPAEATGIFNFGNNTVHRYMIVQVNSPVRAKTLLNTGNGFPVHVNAALVCPHVINVIPRTIIVR